jgi:hypothetical protein
MINPTHLRRIAKITYRRRANPLRVLALEERERRIRWLVTFEQTILRRPHDWWDRRGPETNGSISFEAGSETFVFVRGSTAFIPGFGELAVTEGEHFEFIDTCLN